MVLNFTLVVKNVLNLSIIVWGTDLKSPTGTSVKNGYPIYRYNVQFYLHKKFLFSSTAISRSCTPWTQKQQTTLQEPIRVDWYLNAGVAFSNLWLMLHCCIDVLKITFLSDFINWLDFDFKMWDLINCRIHFTMLKLLTLVLLSCWKQFVGQRSLMHSQVEPNNHDYP